MALAARGITGAGRSIAVVARTDFRDADVASFGQLFGAPAPRPPHRLVPGANPGISLDSQEVAEVLLDTEWAGALAPQADVTVVIAVPGSAKGGDIPDALRTAVERRTADVVTMSFGLCEPDTHVATTQLFDTLYAISTDGK